MTTRAWLPALAALGVTSALTAACGSNPRPQVPTAPLPAPAAAPQAAAPRRPPRSDRCTDRDLPEALRSRRTRAQGRPSRTGAGGVRPGGRRHARVSLRRAHRRRAPANISTGSIDRINAYEVTALAQGDGFVEKKYEPASIDELLKIADVPEAGRRRGDDRGGQTGPGGDRARHPDSAEQPRARLRRAVPGTAAGFHQEASPAARSICR